MKQAIYREYRPKTFEEVLGQEHITKILENQVENNKIGHAYIFSGTRGTGKTSCAKILARAVNCLNPVNGSPCNQCENCKSIIEEETMDIVEMDAASNRRIDDIRELRDKVVYPPSKLKYKVYIIDEAHMITNEGFNALLKIMEEPPKHLIFILATTEIEKIPPTILSRCQRYEFKRIEISDIKKNIEKILSNIDINMDLEAIDLIANYADGAMRDALSILDQVLSIGSDNISLEDVENVLGIVDNESIFNLVNSIIQKDYINSIKNLHKSSNGKPIINVISELINHYRNLLLAKNNLNDYMDMGKELIDKYQIQVQDINIEQLVDSLDILLEYELNMKKSDNPKILAEVCISRLVNYINYDDLQGELRALKRKIEEIEKNGIKISNTNIKLEENSENKTIKPETNQIVNEKITISQDQQEDVASNLVIKEIDDIEKTKEPNTKKTEEIKVNQTKENKEAKEKIDINENYMDLNDRWEEIVSKVNSPMIYSMLNSAVDVFVDAGKFVVLFEKKDEHLIGFLSSEKNIIRIKEAIKIVLNKDMKVQFFIKDDYNSPNKPKGKDNVKLLEKVFGKGNFEIK